MFGKPSITMNSRLIKQLEEGERRPAQHERPRSVTDKGFNSFATPGIQAVFEGFDFFGALMNQHIAKPWTIEETGDTLVKDWSSDSPELGRTYQVFYNGVTLGRLQVTEGANTAGGFREKIEWHRENRAAHALLELNQLRYVPYEDVLSLVSTIELLVGPFENNDIARPRARANAAAALTGYLWEVQRADDQYAPDFEHRVDGPYDLLKLTTDHWKEGGIDPFERWNGDRVR
ncbi:hypothetical protein PSQ90_14995 [Devosia rhodophyticola]|uniref:Uncharacterized protein n=1 Tax=Devosia rhodophyticola TaxID=3026423 RepID=A0ABY7YWU6_9HYPH|nr:hypothetical protein [Devosia rhodophyticola]WDR05563.1 hypothetical protein PSQ90_14995 [Devosia rhodophyticola]